MFQLTNDRLGIQISDEGKLSIIDLMRDKVWQTEYIPGWVMTNDIREKIPVSKVEEIKSGGDSLRILYSTRKIGDTDFKIKIEIVLGRDYFDLILSEVMGGIEWSGIEYPSHILNIPSSILDGYIVVPYHQGVIIPTRINAGFMRFMHNTWMAITDIERILPFESGSINMPWFGAHCESSNILCINLTPEDSLLHIIGNANLSQDGILLKEEYPSFPVKRISSLSPVWLSSHNRLEYPRIIRIKSVDNGYVGMCKEYLSYAKNTRRYVSLKEKSDKNPQINRIIGAPDIKIYIYTNRKNEPASRAWSGPILNGYSKLHTSFKRAEDIVLRLKSENIENSLILLAGWNRAGYDREHVDVWPPSEVAGGVEGLRSLSKGTINQGYLFALHDNYQDFYPDAPSYDESYIMKNKDGSIKLGGIWDGGLCHLICSSQMKELLERNIDLIQRNIDINSYYLDTITAAPLYECYDLIHPIRRKEDKNNKLEVLKFLSEKDLIVGGEGGTDWAVPVCTFFEGLPGSAVGYFSGIEAADFGISTPLFNLVYHDAVVCYWQHGQPFGREDHINHILHDLLSGQPSSWSLTYDQFEDLLPLIKQVYNLLGKFHKKVAFYEMIEHKFLSEDFAVQTAYFGNGAKVAVNFGISSFPLGDIKIPPKGFIISDNSKDLIIGRVTRDIVYT